MSSAMTDGKCVFCDRIAAADYEWGWYDVVAFEPLNPVTPGHMLFVPRRHVVSAVAAPNEAAAAMRRAASYASVGEGSDAFNFITSAGEAATQTVLHLHVHLVPRREDDGLALPWTGQRRSPENA